jgi:hypothetical protein
MARTLEGAALTRAHSARQLALRATTLRDLLGLWSTVDPRDLSGSIHVFVRAAGALTKLVLAGGRMTLLRSVEADPRTIGWGRVTSGDPCAFCRMLAGRGPAYGSKRSADFEAHDSCACTAEPSYEGSEPSAQAVQYQREWKAAQEQAAQERAEGVERPSTANNALNAYRRYLAGGE